MTNADLFRAVFNGLMATEMWAKPESEFLEWLNAEATAWVNVNDRLPDEKKSKITHDFEYVLCATTFGDVRAYKFGTPIGWSKPHFWNGAEEMDEYVTHWMPFPDMPDIT